MKMTKILVHVGFLVVLSADMALADDDCFVPMADWQPRDAVVRLADESGWTVRRIKIDDGCYEIKGSDADGRRIEVTLHPATLDVIDIEYEDEDDDEEKRSRKQKQGSDND